MTCKNNISKFENETNINVTNFTSDIAQDIKTLE